MCVWGAIGPRCVTRVDAGLAICANCPPDWTTSCGETLDEQTSYSFSSAKDVVGYLTRTAAWAKFRAGSKAGLRQSAYLSHKLSTGVSVPIEDYEAGWNEIAS